MLRFSNLFFARLNVRNGWIGAGSVRLLRGFWVGKIRVGGLTRVFAGNPNLPQADLTLHDVSRKKATSLSRHSRRQV